MLLAADSLPKGPVPDVEVFQDWLETEGGARLVVERSGRIIWSNARARRLLSEGSCLTMTAGQLVAAHRARHAELRTFLDNLNGGPEVAVLTSGEETKPPVVIIGCALRVDSGDYLGLRIRQVSDAPRLLVADLTPAYRLTGSERQVVRRLVEGETAEAISKANGQSIDTVRTHIRNIYNKIGVSSREALFARVFQYLFWLD